jgi:hypothetical protein
LKDNSSYIIKNVTVYEEATEKELKDEAHVDGEGPDAPEQKQLRKN